MSKVSYFFKENIQKIENIKVHVSDRFKDEKGNAVPWEIRRIGQDEVDQLKEMCTKQTKKKGVVISETTDNDKFAKLMIVNAVVEPNLKEKALLDNYGVINPVTLLSKMLDAGEYARLAEEVMKFNEFDEEEVVEAVKN